MNICIFHTFRIFEGDWFIENHIYLYNSIHTLYALQIQLNSYVILSLSEFFLKNFRESICGYRENGHHPFTNCIKLNNTDVIILRKTFKFWMFKQPQGFLLESVLW